MIPDYEERLDKLFVNAFPSDHPAMNDWVKLKFELQEMRKTDDEGIAVVIDMNSRDIAEYYGGYDHASVCELLNNVDEMLEFIEDDIDKTAEWIKCNLVWERADPDDCSTTYLVLEYVGKHVYCDENGKEMQ